MSKTRKFQDYAEDIDSSESDEMVPQTLDDSVPDTSDLTEATKKLEATANILIDKADTIGVTIDGIGRWLLNEDGTIRDFTNVKLMNDIGKKVDDGLSAMNANATNIEESIKNMPTHIDATFSRSAFDAIYKLNGNLRLERIIFIVAAVIVAAIAAFTFYKGYAVSERSEELSRWYEENNEAILFGRYLRVNENDRWRFWHDKWVNDPGLKEDMSDYFLIEELKEKRKK